MSEQNIETTERNQRKVRRGYVVSDKMDKTIVVEVEERYKHSLYVGYTATPSPPVRGRRRRRVRAQRRFAVR